MTFPGGLIHMAGVALCILDMINAEVIKLG